VFAQFQELVGPESVGLFKDLLGSLRPEEVPSPRTLLTGTDTVLPVIVGGETATRPPQHRYFESSEEGNHVFAEAVFIRMSYPVVNTPPEVFGEVSMHFGRDSIDVRRSMNCDARWRHTITLFRCQYYKSISFQLLNLILTRECIVRVWDEK
jgi:hypothetical protein